MQALHNALCITGGPPKFCNMAGPGSGPDRPGGGLSSNGRWLLGSDGSSAWTPLWSATSLLGPAGPCCFGPSLQYQLIGLHHIAINSDY